jgi:putative transposase
MEMPRTARLLMDKGFYHILTRGNNRRNVFQNPDDYSQLREIIKTYIEKFPVSIFHYCLMPNHIHLLIQSGKSSDLPKFMQGILQVYANYFRKKYDSTGFLFQNRYRSLHIEKESYLLECARYIERNPLRAKICRDLKDYFWSSYRFYAEGKEDPIVKKPNPCFFELARAQIDRQRMFYEYVIQERPYDHIVDKAFQIR